MFCQKLNLLLRLVLVWLFGSRSLLYVYDLFRRRNRRLIDGKSIPSGRRVFVINCADYTNLGDHAITMGEKILLSLYSAKQAVFLEGTIRDYYSSLLKIVSDEDVICFQGGGNMGDLYFPVEFDRMLVVESFPNNRVIFLPSTVSYDSSFLSNLLLRLSKRVYSKHHDLHMLARESKSYKEMLNLYPHVDVRLTPDAALAIDCSPYLDPISTRNGVLLVLRSDKESVFKDADFSDVTSLLKDKFDIVKFSDTVIGSGAEYLSMSNGQIEVQNKLLEFAKYKLVVTDRFHGMIFSALTGTPCIALNNCNGKVGEEFAWLKELGFIFFASCPTEVIYLLNSIKFTPGIYSSSDYISKFDCLDELL